MLGHLEDEREIEKNNIPTSGKPQKNFLFLVATQRGGGGRTTKKKITFFEARGKKYIYSMPVYF